MKKLYLTSTKISGIIRILKKSPKKTRVAFILTAANPYEDKWFIQKDKKQWQELEFSLVEIDLHNKKENELRILLNGFDIIYLAGGNTFYLLEKIRESGFDTVIVELVNSGVIYAGGSAGAVVAGPTIEPVNVFDDPNVAPNLKDYSGLGLVNFITLPHYGGDELHVRQHKKLMKLWTKKGFQLVPITNNQAIVVEGEKWEVIEV